MSLSSLVKGWFGKRQGTMRNNRPGSIQTRKQIGARKSVKPMLELLEDRLAPARVGISGTELDLTVGASETLTVAPSPTNSSQVQITTNGTLTDNNGTSLTSPYNIPAGTTIFNVYLANTQGQGDQLTFGLGSSSGIAAVNIGANPNPATTPAQGTDIATDTHDSVTLTTTQLNPTYGSLNVNAGTINFFGSAFVPYVGTVKVAASGTAGEYIITPASGQNWVDLGFTQGATVTLTGVDGTESGNAKSAGLIPVGFNATFNGATCHIANIQGDSLYVNSITPVNLSYSYYDEDTGTAIAVPNPSGWSATSGPSLTSQSDTGATVSANTSSAQVQAFNMTLTSLNSLLVQSTGAPYLGPVTINAAPLANQPYAGDPYLTGPDWGTYFYAPGQVVSFTDANGTAQSGTVAAIVGDNLYLVMSASPATGTNSNDTVQCTGFTPQISAANLLTLNVTGQGSILGAMDVYGVLSATTLNGNITIEDVDLGGKRLAIENLNAGSGTIELAAVGSIVSSFSETAAQAAASNFFNLVAGAVDLMTTGTGSSIGAITTPGDAAGTVAADLILATNVGQLTATTNDGDVFIQNGSSALTIDSVVADQGGQSPTVNQDRVVYNSTPGSGAPTWSAGTSLVQIASAGPILLNSISATGDVTITGKYIVDGNGQSQSIIAPSVELNATGAANYEGQVAFAGGTAGSGDTLTLPSTGPTWSALGFGTAKAGDSVVIAGASDTANNGTFTIASVSGHTLTLQQSFVLDPETEFNVTVGDGVIGLPSTASSNAAIGAIHLSEVGTFSAQTANGSIYLALGNSIDSAAASVIAGGTGNVTVTSAASFLTVENITAVGGGAMLAPGQVLKPGDSLFSFNNAFELVLQGNGNLVWSGPVPGPPLWSSNTGGKTVTQAIMQTDGNLVLYNGTTAVWASNTSGNPGAYLALQNDGNLVIYSTRGAALWSSGTFGAAGASPLMLLGGNVAVGVQNGALIEYPGNDGSAGIITGRNVSVTSSLSIGSVSYPLLTNASVGLAVTASATSPSSAAVYVNNISSLSDITVSTYDGSVTVNDDENTATGAFTNLLSFNNNLVGPNVLLENGSAVVTFSNTDANDGSNGNVLLAGTIQAGDIRAGGQILASSTNAPTIEGLMVMLSAGSGIGLPGTLINTRVSALDAATTTGSVYINQPAAGTGATVAFTVSNGSITSVTPTPVSGGSGYPANATFYLSVGGGTGGIIRATTDSAGNMTFAASPIAGGTGYSTNTSGASTSAVLLLSASTSSGNIFASAAGDIDLFDQTETAPDGQSTIEVSAISTNAGGTVTLVAPNGTIYNPSHVTANTPTVTAGTLSVTAKEVGTSSNSLETSVSSLTTGGSATSGGLFLSNNEPLTVSSAIRAGDLSISTIGNLTLHGSLDGSNVNLTATAGALTATTTTTTGGITTSTVNSGVSINADTLTMRAEQIGDSSAYSPAGSGYEATDFLQTRASTIIALANYGGIYISNGSSQPLTLTAAAIGPTPGGTVTNDIEVYSRSSIILDPQTNALTALEAPQPVAVFNPGGSAELFVGHTVNADGTTGTIQPGFTIASAFCVVSGLGDTSGLTPGMSVRGAGIPAGDVIAVVNPTGSHGDGEIELAYAPTATASNVSLTFTSASGPTVTLTGNINGTAPSATASAAYFDVESGSWSQDVSNSDVNYSGKAPLVLTVNGTEIVPPPPGGGASALVEVISEYQLEQGSGAYQPIAGSIIIENDMDAGGAAVVQIPGPLSLTATNGPIVFLNPNDTLDVTTGSITIQAHTVAVLGNLTTNNGDVNVSTVGNITIGTVDAGSSTVTLKSTSGNVFSSNGGSGTNALKITAGTTNVISAGHPASASQSASLVELNATQAIATADAATAQAAADQTTASAFLSALTSINGQLNSIHTTVANDQQTYQFDLQATNQENSQVTTDSNTVTAESWSYDGLSAAANALSLTAAIIQQANSSALAVQLSVVDATGGIFGLGAVELQGSIANVIANGFSLASALINVAGSAVSFALTADTTTLGNDQAILANDQAAQAEAYVQLQADLSTQTALTDEYDAILQAYNTAAQAATAEQTTAMQDQVVSAQAIAAVVATATPQPVTVSGNLVMTDQVSGAGGSGIAITTPIASSATTGQPGATIKSGSPLTVGANITFPGPIDLTAEPELSTETGDDLTVASGVTIQSTGSSVSLTAGDNVVIPAGATIDANSASTITITGDENDDGGANVTVNGTLVAQSALIGVDPNSPGNDTFTITPSATAITVTGGRGTNTLNLDAGGQAVTISGDTITVAGMKPVTFTNIEIVKITNKAGGGSVTLTGLSGQANTMSLVGTGQGAGTATLNGVAISFSGMTSFSYQGGGAGDTIAVTPFATSPVGWNLAVTVGGGSGTPASLTYNSVGSTADTVTATGPDAGSIASQGLVIIQFSNVHAIRTNASQSSGAQLAVNLPVGASPDTANVLSVGSGTADINFGLFGLAVDTADYGGLTINGNTVGCNNLVFVTSTGAGLPISLTLNYPSMHSAVNTGAASSVAATASGDVIGVTSAGVVEVTDLFGNFSEFAVTGSQLVFSNLGNKDTINIAGNNPFTNGIDVNGNASFTDVINYTAGSNAAVTVTPSTSTVSQAGGGAVYYAGIGSVNLAASGSTAALTVDGSATAEAFEFNQTGAGAGSFTVVGSAAAINTSPPFTYTGFGDGVAVKGGTTTGVGNGVTVNGGTSSGLAILSLPARTGNLATMTGTLATVTGYSYVNESVGATMTLTTGQHAGLVARYTGAGGQSMDLGFIVAGSKSYTAYIYRNVNGTWAPLFNRTYSGSVAANSRLMFDAVGSSLILSLNGKIIGTATDTVLASRAGSVGMWTSSRAVMSNFVAAPVTPQTASTPFRDNFTTSSATGSLSAYWTNQTGAFQVNTSNGTATAAAPVALATVNGVSESTANVSATITLAPGQYAGLVTRYAGTGVQNMYFGEIVAGSGTYRAYIYRINKGVRTQLAASRTYHGSVTGAVLKFAVSGTSLTLTLNGTAMATATDSTLRGAGSVGILSSGGATISSFSVD